MSSCPDDTATHEKTDKMEAVAVVGMACRYPDDATSPSAFFEMLVNARSAWSEVPENRYNLDAYWHPNKERIGTTTSRGAHWMKEDPACFDAPFFSMSAGEATALDPQLRMLLEVTFECLDDAGKPMENLVGGDTSVYVASSSSEYSGIMLHDQNDIPLYAAVGSGTTMLANRLSHFYDLRGPSIAIDTACSGGLVAAHFGCEAIRTGQSKTSLVAASQLILGPGGNLALQRLQFLSPDSRCFTFDDRANGYARGEGICVLMLKNLSEALKDGDTIRAVIRASGTNQDGKTPGIVQPNSEAQAALIRQTYKAAGLDYDGTSYFEAHGTGTKLGDPLELNAVSTSLETQCRDSSRPLYVGSVKTNIGHLEGGAGLAGLMKTILSLEHGVILPNVNFENANPNLCLDDWHITVPTKAMQWPTAGLRRASVNSFGYGGSNAHCIVDDARNYLRLHNLKGNTKPVHPFSRIDFSSDDDSDSGYSSPPHSPEDIRREARLFVFSSPEQAALQRLASRYADYLENKFSKSMPHGVDYLDNLAFTLGSRRSIFQWRTAVTADSIDQLTTSLRQPVKGYRTSKTPGTVYCFTGQGAQWHAMGRELMQYDIFCRSLFQADAYIKSLGADWSVLEELGASEETSKLDLAKYSQPLCTVLQVGLVDLLFSWNVRPTAVVGHSSGEIAAAYAAGYLSAEDCYKIAYERGRLSGELSTISPKLTGSMLAAGLSDQQARPYLERLDSDDNVVVACVNSPTNITLSGDAVSIGKLESFLNADNVFARRLKVQVAYHSPHMQVLAEQYSISLQDVKPQRPDHAPLMFSTVTGALIDGALLDASYWVRNMVSPVLFIKAIEAVFPFSPVGARRNRRGAISADTILEIGPHSALQGPLRQILSKLGRLDKTEYLSMLSRGRDASATSLEAMGRLWTKGQQVELARINKLDRNSCPPYSLPDLPNYPWNHTNKYWHEDWQVKNHRFRAMPRLDLLGAPVADWNPHEPQWQNVVRLSDTPWLSDHKIQDSILYPASSMICAVLEAGQQLADVSAIVEGYELRNLVISHALVIPSSEKGVATALRLKRIRSDTETASLPSYEFRLYSEVQGQDPIENYSGVLQIHYAPQKDMKGLTSTSDSFYKSEYSELRGRCIKELKPERFYEDWMGLGIHWGQMFQGLSDIRFSEDAACFTITVKDTRAVMPAGFEYSHLIHPTTLEACFQASFAPSLGKGKGRIPTSIESLYVAAKVPEIAGATLVGYTTLIRAGFNKFTADAVVSDGSWDHPKVKVTGVAFTPFREEATVSEKKPWDVRKLCSQISYKEDIDHVRQAEADVMFRECDDPVAMWMDLSGHKRPSQRILEVNNEDFSLTVSILSRLGGKVGTTPLFGQYVATHNDTQMIENTKQLLNRWEDYHVEPKLLNLKECFVDQGFDRDHFDTIILGNAATESVRLNSEILHHCFEVLQPGGKLLLNGVLHSRSSWNKLLRGHKLSDIKVLIKGCRNQNLTAIASKAPESKRFLSDVVIVQPSTVSKDAQMFTQGLVEGLAALGIRSETCDLEKITDERSSGLIAASNTRTISLLEIEAPFIHDLSQDDFQALKTLLTKGPGGLWISRSNLQLDPSGDPSFCATAALLRCIRYERPDAPMYELSLSSQFSMTSPEAADLVIRGFKSMFEEKPTGSIPEVEFAESEGRLLIPRLYDHKPLNDRIDRLGKRPMTEMESIVQKDRPLKLEIGSTGKFDTLHFSDDERFLKPLADNEVQINVFANGINFQDIRVSTGVVADTELGFDAAGIVTGFGPKVSHVAVGDRVAALCMGACCNILRVHENLVAKLPDKMSFEEGASLPSIYTIAYHAIISSGRLDAGETILIHNASGGLGQAAIHLAKHIGAQIFATAGSETKRQLLMDEFGLSADRIFDSREHLFAKGITKMTNGRGVDVILNSTSGATLRKTWECISTFGRFLDVEKRDTLSNNGLNIKPFSRNVTLVGINLEHMLRHDPLKASKAFHASFKLICEGKLGRIQPTNVHKWSDMQTVFRTMQEAQHIGKMVFTASPGDLVPVIPRTLGTTKLDSDATYVIVGGLGGIGRSLVIWLAGLEAKHIAIISRSGTSKPEAKSALEELMALGVDAKSYICDIVDPEAFSATVSRISSELPPVKGAIHCAMIVNDYFFSEMTYEQWHATISVKVQGAWNMHTYLPKHLDFFVMLSSASGYIGSPKLSAYAAGNTYNDGLAQYRRGLGLKACAPGFGFIAGIGWARENVKISDSHKADYDLMSIHPPQVRAIIESAISGYAAGDVPMPAQIATTMGTGGELQHMKLIKTRDYYKDPKFAYLAQLDVRKDLEEQKIGGTDLKSALETSASLAHATDVVEGALATKLAHSMSMAPDDIDTSKPVSAYGVDSLVSMEVRNWVHTVLRSTTGVYDILNSGPIVQLAAKIAENSALVPEAVRLQGEPKIDELVAQ